MYVAVLRSRSMSSAEPMVDAHGNVAWMPMLPDVPVQFEGEGAAGSLDFIMNSYEQTEGILAPQDLVRSGWALVIDLGRDARGG